MSEQEQEQPRGPLRIRSAELAAVSFPQRTIDLVVIPYETDALVPHPTDPSRMVVETVGRGAFDGVERRANRVRCLRDHDVQRPVGRFVSLSPSNDDGLIGRVRISKTPLGDETLELADDGILDASAGFRPFPGGETWLSRSAYRVTKAFLGHVALTPEPAYDGAEVLAVRAASRERPSEGHTRPDTPNLDLLRAADLSREYARLDRSFLPGVDDR